MQGILDSLSALDASGQVLAVLARLDGDDVEHLHRGLLGDDVASRGRSGLNIRVRVYPPSGRGKRRGLKAWGVKGGETLSARPVDWILKRRTNIIS